MNKLYKNLIKIGSVIMAFLAMHFYPNYWTHILVAILAAFVVDFVDRHSEKYTCLKWLQIAKENAREYTMKRELNKIIEKEEHEKYKKILIENALEKAKSSDESKRRAGLEQLSQFGEEYAYEKLLEILKNDRLDKLHEKQMVETLYKIIKDMDKY